MKQICIFIILSFLLISSSGCDGSSGNENEPQPENNDIGIAPEIVDVNFYVNGDLTSHESDLPNGSQVLVHVHCKDPDLDITTLQITLYNTDSPDDPWYGPDVYLVPATTNTTFIYQYKPTISDPPGKYEVEYIVGDAQGNESSKWREGYTIVQ